MLSKKDENIYCSGAKGEIFTTNIFKNASKEKTLIKESERKEISAKIIGKPA